MGYIEDEINLHRDNDAVKAQAAEEAAKKANRKANAVLPQAGKAFTDTMMSMQNAIETGAAVGAQNRDVAKNEGSARSADARRRAEQLRVEADLLEQRAHDEEHMWDAYNR